MRKNTKEDFWSRIEKGLGDFFSLLFFFVKGLIGMMMKLFFYLWLSLLLTLLVFSLSFFSRSRNLTIFHKA